MLMHCIALRNSTPCFSAQLDASAGRSSAVAVLDRSGLPIVALPVGDDLQPPGLGREPGLDQRLSP